MCDYNPKKGTKPRKRFSTVYYAPFTFDFVMNVCTIYVYSKEERNNSFEFSTQKKAVY